MFDFFRPGSLDEVVRQIAEVSARDTSRRYVWRGHGDRRWGLAPSIYRRIVHFLDIVPSEQDVSEFETDLMARAMGRGFYDGISHASTYALLQHRGAATRLLDVTRDPLIALWFAVEDESIEAAARLFAIDVTNVRVVSATQRPGWRDVANSGRPGDLVLYEPPWIDDRVKAQRALFLSNVLDGSQTRDMAYSPRSSRALGAIIEVAGSLKPDLREYLDANHGIHAESMFPDLDGFAQSYGVRRHFRHRGEDLLRWG